MAIKANPENVRKCEAVQALMNSGVKRKIALERAGLKNTTFRAWQNRQRDKAENDRHRAWLLSQGISVPDTKWKHRVTK